MHRQGLDFADALHWALSRHCEELVRFDDRRFARRLRKLGLQPSVRVPTATPESALLDLKPPASQRRQAAPPVAPSATG